MMYASKNKVDTAVVIFIQQLDEKNPKIFKHDKCYRLPCVSPGFLTKNEISPRVFLQVLNKVFLESDLRNHNQSKYLWNHRRHLKVKKEKILVYKNMNNNEKKKMKYKI